MKMFRAIVVICFILFSVFAKAQTPDITVSIVHPQLSGGGNDNELIACSGSKIYTVTVTNNNVSAVDLPSCTLKVNQAIEASGLYFDDYVPPVSKP